MGVPLDHAAAARTAFDALAKGEAARARDLFEQLAAAGRADVATCLGLARARAALGDFPGKLAAIDQALALDARSLLALTAKADHLAEAGETRAASAHYQAVLQHLPRFKELPTDHQQALLRAKAWTERAADELESFVRARLAEQGITSEPGRLSRSVDIMFGKRQPYFQNPRYLFYPELPQIQFYERSAFPWMDAIEAAAADIRAECQAAIGDVGEFEPYLSAASRRPSAGPHRLAGNPSWGAYFLWKDGKEQPGAAKCPRTMEALKHAPLTSIPGRAPSILYSKLAAGAHIPPHSGMINARLICHLGLIVPNDCALRVGNEIGVWREGKCWAFDDSIEHEAWNRSAVDRYILLFDVWRPELSEEERIGVSALCAAVDAYGGGSVVWDV